jgi:hypothetical protein
LGHETEHEKEKEKKGKFGGVDKGQKTLRTSCCCNPVSPFCSGLLVFEEREGLGRSC